MRNSICTTILATVILFILQIIWVHNMYLSYTKEQSLKVKDSFSICLEKELHSRNNKKNFVDSQKPRVTIKAAKYMSPEERNKYKGDTLNISTSQYKGKGNGISDVISQIIQESLMDSNPLRLSVLDSLFNDYLTSNSIRASYYIATYDKDTILTDHIGSLTPANTKPDASTLYPIGTKGRMFVQMHTEITLSDFIKQQSIILAIFSLLVLIAIICIIYQLRVIKRKDEELRRRETCINGTIHDLKTPINNVWMLMKHIIKDIIDSDKRALLEKGIVQTQELIDDIDALMITARKDRQKIHLQPQTTEGSYSIFVLFHVLNPLIFANSKSIFALLYICLLIAFSLLTDPSSSALFHP